MRFPGIDLVVRRDLDEETGVWRFTVTVYVGNRAVDEVVVTQEEGETFASVMGRAAKEGFDLKRKWLEIQAELESVGQVEW